MNSSNKSQKIGWAVSKVPVPYPKAVDLMQERVTAIHAGEADELVWLLQHPPLITAGTSAKQSDLLDPKRFEVFKSGRGGQFTYHGPGQRVAYIMLDLNKRGRDVRGFVSQLEQWLITSLGDFDLPARRYDDRVGVWVSRKNADGSEGEAKIAAIGIRIRRWVSFHGISLNINPDLSHFEAIVPCGISEFGVTSFADLGKPQTMSQVDRVLQTRFVEQFGAFEPVTAPLP
ncbi:Octanoate-[acyl-carrier-protein]-protein-N-octanoyltransferase [hydrothermal vent metagenome]|uniref:lipoyl(octanoyl) transferase n=1 Tax=hydrothermal vent metagenome TaxID=652676 RepID=A0A3B0R5K9_9ZZZZ